MLSKKLVEVLGWLAQADELTQRCQDDLTRSRTFRTPEVKKQGQAALESLTRHLEAVRKELKHAAFDFFCLERYGSNLIFNRHYEKGC